MLTDEEIIKIAADTKTGEPGLHGYILPISFAREIERAVLAKATNAIDENSNDRGEPDAIYLQLHDPDSLDDTEKDDFRADGVTWCWHSINHNDVRYIREDLAKTMPIPKQEPDLFIVYNGVCISGIYYDRKSAEQYRESKQKEHSLSGSIASFHIKEMYCDPQPAQAAAIPEAMKHLTDSGGYYDDCYINGWNACREAMLSASPKPE